MRNEEAIHVVAFDQEPVEAIVDWEAAKGVWLLRQESRTNAKEVVETCCSERKRNQRGKRTTVIRPRKKEIQHVYLGCGRQAPAGVKRPLASVNAIIKGGEKLVTRPMDPWNLTSSTRQRATRFPVVERMVCSLCTWKRDQTRTKGSRVSGDKRER